MRLAWFTVCLLAGPAALGQSAIVPDEVQVSPQSEGVLVAPLFSSGLPAQLAPPVWQNAWRGQVPRTFSFANPVPMPPVAKGTPIPTQWPNAKFEPIPTRWPNLQALPLGPQQAPVPLPALPRRK